MKHSFPVDDFKDMLAFEIIFLYERLSLIGCLLHRFVMEFRE